MSIIHYKRRLALIAEYNRSLVWINLIIQNTTY